MYKSKRFIAFVVGVCLFVLMVYTTPYSPLEIAAAIGTITSIYIGAETLKPSTNAPDGSQKITINDLI